MATMSRSPLKEELIVQLRRTIPVSLSHLMRRSLDVMSVAVLGHIGKDVLAAGALAQSTVNTVALSVLVGLSSATVTLTSQAVLPVAHGPMVDVLTRGWPKGWPTQGHVRPTHRPAKSKSRAQPQGQGARRSPASSHAARNEHLRTFCGRW